MREAFESVNEMSSVSNSKIQIQKSKIEALRRDEILANVIACVREGQTIKLPPFDRNLSQGGKAALTSVGLEPNDFGGTVGPYRYQFEGEEDLLHLVVTRLDQEKLTPAEGKEVAAFVLGKVPSSLVWLRPGEYSQHFYLAHDVLLQD